jgi:DNA-binding response OmpR family regulator
MKKKIVVAEDDEGIRDSLKLILEGADYEVEAFPDGEPLLSNEPVPADIYLIDRQLMGVDGLSVCRHLKQHSSSSKTPVIILSATPHIQLMVKNSGADAFIEKPFSKKDLIQTIQNILNTTALSVIFFIN